MQTPTISSPDILSPSISSRIPDDAPFPRCDFFEIVGRFFETCRYCEKNQKRCHRSSHAGETCHVGRVWNLPLLNSLRCVVTFTPTETSSDVSYESNWKTNTVETNLEGDNSPNRMKGERFHWRFGPPQFLCHTRDYSWYGLRCHSVAQILQVSWFRKCWYRNGLVKINSRFNLKTHRKSLEQGEWYLWVSQQRHRAFCGKRMLPSGCRFRIDLILATQTWSI